MEWYVSQPSQLLPISGRSCKMMPLFLTLSLYTSLALNVWALPAEANMAVLNQTVRGRLYEASPFARPCFSILDGHSVISYPAQCSEIQAQYSSAAYRTESYSGFMYIQGEICPSSDDLATSQCLLNPTNPDSPSASKNASCGQGSVSTHYIEVAGAEDVQATFAFAERTGVSLSVKNSGHDYLSRSSRKGSLALWTRKLQKLEYIPSFSAQGCLADVSHHNAFTLGAGVNFDQVYHFADQNNVTFVGGSSPTVGASGGFTMTGGHGLLTSQFGLGIDRVLQFKIVTPDGVLRTANACQNQDLFWALRGGGGGTYGVVLESTSKVEPALSLVFASISLPTGTTDTALFTRLMMDNAIRLSQEGWGGPSGLSFMAMVNPFLDLDKAKKSMAPISDYVTARGGTVTIEQHPNFYSIYKKYVASTGDEELATTSLTTNRLIPTTLLQTESGKATILEHLDRLTAAGFSPTLFATTPAYYNYTLGSTSATPAWRDSTWMITTATSWGWNSTVIEKKTTVKKLKDITSGLQALAPSSGSYVSEADPWTVDWRQSWWGENYAKLLELKKKYDPHGLLNCWRCVGWDEALAKDEFRCIGALDQ